MEFGEGKAKGVAALEVRTGSGLEFTLLPDKCLDIYALRYKGITLSQQAKTGLQARSTASRYPASFRAALRSGNALYGRAFKRGPKVWRRTDVPPVPREYRSHAR